MSIPNTEAAEIGNGVTPVMDGGEAATEGANSFSVIDRHSNFDGTFRSSRDLRIEGEVKGTIECQGTLFVAEGANVSAKIEAENIAVAGDLNGDIRCLGRLQIMPSGRVRGKVSTITLVINEGAYYEGQLEMAPPEERQNAGIPRSIGSRPAASAPVSLPAAAPTTPRPAPPPSAAEPTGASPSTFIRRLGGPETPWENRGGNDQPEEEETPRES
jgi:cytoskeletal protein CcmA (bactofilin family)